MYVDALQVHIENNICIIIIQIMKDSSYIFNKGQYDGNI